jgi:hypothetical protein
MKQTRFTEAQIVAILQEDHSRSELPPLNGTDGLVRIGYLPAHGC